MAVVDFVINSCYHWGMNNVTPVEALQSAIDLAGGQSALAAKLPANDKGDPVSQARVWNWINRDKRAPAEVCPDIEALTGVKCEALRPDVNWLILRKQPKRIKSTTAV